MSFYGGKKLATMYDETPDEGFGLTAGNIAEPNIIMGLTGKADRMDSGLLLQMSGEACRFAGGDDVVADLKAMGNYIETITEWYDIGIFLNMDHQTDLEFIEQQIELDIPLSIMTDASHGPPDEDVAMSRRVVEMVEVADSDALIKTELSQIKGTEDGIKAEEAFYMDLEQAVEFVDKTGADLLVISVGTQHGVAKSKDLELRPDLVNDVRQVLRDHDLGTPLVLHGPSDIQPDQLQEVLKHGTCKVNKDTRYRYEYTCTACDRYNEEPNVIVPPEGVANARGTSFSETDWSLNKNAFDPRIAGRNTREYIADVHTDLAEASGSTGQSLFK